MSAAYPLVRRVATSMLASLPELTDAHVTHLEEAWDGYERLEDDARADLRRGIEANLEEVCSLLRSDIAPGALLTPVGAVGYARRMRTSGVRLRSLEQAYHDSLAMTRGVAAALVEQLGEEDERLAATTGIEDLLWAYVGRAVRRLGDGYGEPTGAIPDRADAMFSRCPAAGLRFVASVSGGDGGAVALAGAHCSTILDRFCDDVEEVSATRAGSRMAIADTTVAVVLADEPDMAATLLLDREPIEIVDGVLADPEAELRIPSVDLKHLTYPEFHAPIAIVRGRIAVRGPARKFLRALPVLRGAVVEARKQAADIGAYA